MDPPFQRREDEGRRRRLSTAFQFNGVPPPSGRETREREGLKEDHHNCISRKPTTGRSARDGPRLHNVGFLKRIFLKTNLTQQTSELMLGNGPTVTPLVVSLSYDFLESPIPVPWSHGTHELRHAFVPPSGQGLASFSAFAASSSLKLKGQESSWPENLLTKVVLYRYTS